LLSFRFNSKNKARQEESGFFFLQILDIKLIEVARIENSGLLQAAIIRIRWDHFFKLETPGIKCGETWDANLIVITQQIQCSVLVYNSTPWVPLIRGINWR
jgi:hypothetical protein